MPRQKNKFSTFLVGRVHSFSPAIRGLKFLLKGEPNATVHLTAAAGAIVLGFLFSISSGEWCLVMLCIALVISAEALNSGIEKTVDLVTEEHLPLAGKAKDLAAAGVLVISIGALITGLIIFIPHVFHFFGW
jgi:diacylglycerol kinase (ATP)